MVNINFSYTAPINPPNSAPTLTVPQIWAGLQRKIRHAQEFVPVIEACQVLSDEDGIVKRVVKFKEGAGHRDRQTAKEVVRSYEWSWVDFEQDNGTHIRNVISDGPGGEGDLNMTYMFEYRLPDVKEGDEAEKVSKRLKEMCKLAVESSINVIREMVKDGRIKV